VFIGLPKSQDANPTAVAFWGLIEAFLHPDAAVAVADWTPQTEARLTLDTSARCAGLGQLAATASSLLASSSASASPV
jgi:hypothetical protein